MRFRARGSEQKSTHQKDVRSVLRHVADLGLRSVSLSRRTCVAQLCRHIVRGDPHLHCVVDCSIFFCANNSSGSVVCVYSFDFQCALVCQQLFVGMIPFRCDMIDGIRSSAGAPRRRKKSTIRSVVGCRREPALTHSVVVALRVFCVVVCSIFFCANNSSCSLVCVYSFDFQCALVCPQLFVGMIPFRCGMIDGIRSSAGAPRRRKKSTIRSWSTRLFATFVKSDVVCGAQRRMCGLARDVEIAKNAFHRSSGWFTNKLCDYKSAASTLQVVKVSTSRSGDLDVAQFEMTKGRTNWKMKN